MVVEVVEEVQVHVKSRLARLSSRLAWSRTHAHARSTAAKLALPI